MLRVYVSFLKEETCRRVINSLKAAGIPVGEVHNAGAAVIRAVGHGGGGLVLCGPRLSDMTAQQLSQALGKDAQIVVLSHEADAYAIEDELILHMPLPASWELLAQRGSVLLKKEEDRQRALHRLRTPAEERLLCLAKEILSARLSITEQEAHSLLQRMSMHQSQCLADVAQKIIENL